MPSAPKSKAPKTTGPTGAQSITQRVAKLNRWRDQYNPLRGLTLARAVALAESFFRGDMADYQWTCYFIEQTDADLFALLEMRNGRIVEMEYTFTPEKDADAKTVAAQTRILTDKFALIDNLYEAIEHLALAPFRGYAHCEKWYGPGRDIVHLEPVDQWNVVRDGLRGAWRYNPEGRSTSYAALPAEADMPAPQFLFREVRRSINRVALFKFIRANLCEKDWDAFVEIYGIPGGVLIGPPDIGDEKADEFREAAEKIAEGGSGYAPHGSTWQPNTAARGTQPFKDRLDHLSEKLVLVGTGGKLTMLNGPTGLGGGQSEVHQDVFDQIAAADAKRISEVINKQLVAEILTAAFPGQKQVVYFRLAANAETDTGAAVDEVQKLSASGFAVDPDEVTERTGWTVTVKPAAPSPFAQTAPERQIANRAAVLADAGRAQVFRAEALQQLSAAQAAALHPLTSRLAEIEGMEDDDEQDAALQKLQADLPKLYRQIAADPVLAQAFEQILGTALVSGAASAAAKQQSSSA